MKIRAAIVGPTGYTGYWLIELLLRHPAAEITYLATAREELPSITKEYPILTSRCDMAGRPIDPEAMAKEAHVAFICLPHKAAMAYVPGLIQAGMRVIDLSADYRLRDAALYERVYQTPHDDRANLANAVYGLPEFFADEIADADLVANPGCYPTAAALGIAPLLQRNLVRPDGICINASSGVTGAGRSAKPHLHFPELNESYSAYSCGNHRHQPEVDQTLTTLHGRPIQTLFTAHLLPIDRGILETIYLDPASDDVTQDDLYKAYADAYAEQHFVRVRQEYPNTKWVRDTNFCDISARLVGEGPNRKVVVFSAIDNMIKGASGQAVQNMNLMFNLDQTAGLR